MKPTIPVPIRFFLILSLAFLAAAPSRAQVTFQLGAGGGVTLPTAEYAGSITDFYDGTKYGFGSGFNLHAKARLGLIGWRFTGEVDYSSLSRKGDIGQGLGNADISQKVLAFRVGPEFYLGVPLAPVTPYIGANVALNNLSGQVQFQGVSKVPSGTYDVTSATRIGFGFNGGLLFNLGTFTSLDLGFSYDMLNATGKSWTVGSSSTTQRLDSYQALNDAKDPIYRAGDDKHFIGSTRNINEFQVTATFMVGI
jgi:hypothetical protein